jgi:hypothetical protein
VTEDLIIADVIRAHPPRRVVFDLADLAPSSLTFGDLDAIAGVLGLDYEDAQKALTGKLGTRLAARGILAVAWVFARRGDPSLTWEDAQGWSLEVTDSRKLDPPRARGARGPRATEPKL